ncbi:MAG: outer membrane protein assembly factor BamE domain-containing protein [Thiobacillus sp.]
MNIGPHRIDVQQGNALDQENVARLKPGLNRSQVRFLLGTPLVIDPFHTDRWDYVYVNYKAGKLAEQKRITLFFDGDTLARIEGDLPVIAPTTETLAPTVQPESKTESTALPVVEEAKPTSAPLATQSGDTLVSSQPEPAPAVVSPPKPAATPAAAVATTAPVARAPEKLAPAPVAAVAVTAPAVVPATRSTMPTDQVSATETSIVSPLPSPKNAPAYVDPRTSTAMRLQPETSVEEIKPDVIPAFPDANPVASASDAPVLKALNAWVDAWSRRDEDAYIAAYDASFVPQGGDSYASWEKRRRLLLNVAKNIELKISSPSVDWAGDGSATITFNQFYRSDSYRDAVVKQLHMVEHDGEWLIVDEKVVSILHGAKP